MSSKTKIVVLHMKELIYTGIFAVLGILFIILLVIMFMPGKDAKKESKSTDQSAYVPGIYSTTLVLGSQNVDVEVVVDETKITSIRLVNLDESIATMYPLIQPTFDAIVTQIYEQQSVEGITYTNDNKYTSMILLESIQTSLDKASAEAVPTTE